MLEPDTEEKGSNKITELKSFLKESLDPDKFSDAMKILGIDEDMTNEQLYEAIKLLLKKPEEEEEDEEKKAAKKKEDEEEEEEEEAKGADRQAWMEKCMKGGKTMEECAAEYKEKYPPPKKEEEPAELAKKKKEDEEEKEMHAKLSPEVRTELNELKAEIGRLKEERRLNEIASKVDEQISEKHLAPAQRDHVIKLMAKLEDEHHEELLGTFSNVKFKGFEDVGQTSQRRPGQPEELDEETRKKILKEHGISDLIEERGKKGRVAS